VSKPLTSLGLMSGTSLDGIDIALLRTDGAKVVHRGASQTYTYDKPQRQLLREALRAATDMTNRNGRTGILGEVEEQLTAWHAEAVHRFLKEISITNSNIDIIGFHGQTALHRPERQLTIQLGNGQTLANATGIKVAYDMRAADVAAGGQGAPLVPVYHQALATGLAETPVAFVNIGGVANVTFVSDDSLIAFDTGPGNALIDDWVLKHHGSAFDHGGALALSGKVDEATAVQFLGDSFFEKPGPKSLDRDAFASVTLDNLSPADGAATLVAVTARAIAESRHHFPQEPAQWIICGGGRKNAAIMKKLRQILPRVEPAETFGFNGDSMEAEAWAYLAVRVMNGAPLSFPGTTGVAMATPGGVIARPN
jgi:anhydro-N-acetylmuramic acid kinase